MSNIEVHGTPDYVELEKLGLTPADVVHFSSNINPYGPPQPVVDAIHTMVTAEQVATYPDRFCGRLRRKLAAHHGVSPASILVGNGTADIMWLLAIGLLRSKRVVVLGPTFSEYENAASIAESALTIVAQPGWRDRDGEYEQADRSLKTVAAEIASTHPDVVFICNPNNPTGRHLTPEEMAVLHDATPDAVWIVDEAYADFTPAPWSAIDWIERGHWIVLRSMTKDFSLGGLRLGYLVANSTQVAELERLQPPWNVNVVAQIAGEVAIDCLAWRDETMVRQRTQIDAMRKALQTAGYAPLPTSTNFFLLPLDGPAAEVRAALLAQGLIVRDCTSFGLPHHIRIAVQHEETNRRLVAELSDLLH